MTETAPPPITPSPRRSRPTLALVFALLIMSVARVSDAAGPPALQAHGSDDRLWIARYEPPTGKTAGTDFTTLYVREKADANWRRIEPIGAAVIGMGSRGSQLAILLPGGEWRLTTDSGYASGRAMPGGATPIALGSDATALWAIATVSPSASSTMPTTASTSASQPTRPTSSPTSTSLVLFRLGAQNWEQQTELPDEIATKDELSLGVAGGRPVVAQKVDAKTIRLFRYTPDKPWETLGEVSSPGAVREFKVLGGSPVPVLWFRPDGSSSRLWIRGPGGATVAKALSEVPQGVDPAVAYANGAIRLLWVRDGKIYEQRRSIETGEADGDSQPMPVPSPSLVPLVNRWLTLTVLAAFVVAMFASFNRRREMLELEIDPEDFRLAPLSTRFIAGTIDAVPVIAACLLTRFFPEKLGEPALIYITLGGFALYLLLTTAVEVIAGRSLGKMLTGMHVVGLDGKPATLNARLLRNMLRVIDLAGIPLALILFSPLRQRAGDFAAGTLVVTGKGSEREEEGPKAKDAKDVTDAKDAE
jgi:uncharacterized RDD family membrane protein YckC